MDIAAYRAFLDQEVAIQGLLHLALLLVLLQPFRDEDRADEHLDHRHLQLQCQGVDRGSRRPVCADRSIAAWAHNRPDHRLVVL